MCYVIVTGRSLVWFMLSLMAFMMQISGILTPKWLIGPPVVNEKSNVTEIYTPTVGIFNRCTKMGSDLNHCGPFSRYGFATESSVYPSTWKAALFFLSLCATIQLLTVLAAILACCMQSICKKSIISLAGATQALAGLFGVIGLLLHPWGWGDARVRKLCGEDSEPFIPSNCSIGWALYASAVGIALTFISAAASKQADKAANSDKVQFQIDEGRQLICLA